MLVNASPPDARADNNRVVIGLREPVVRLGSSRNGMHRMVATIVWHELFALKTLLARLFSGRPEKHATRIRTVRGQHTLDVLPATQNLRMLSPDDCKATDRISERVFYL